MFFGLQVRKITEHGARKRNKCVCVCVCVCVEHAFVKRRTQNIEVLKKCEPRLCTIYIRPLMIEVEDVFVAVASLDGRG
jgi:hypothetical protein